MAADGTLIGDDVTLFNREVTPAQYRRAAATAPRLPKLPSRIGKPPVHNRALERHTHRVFVAWLLKKRSRVEARTWQAAADKKKRTFGRFKRASTAVKFIEELYQAGAVQVIAPEIYHNKRGDQFADCLLVQFPKSIRQRHAIRAVCARYFKDGRGAVQPEQDWGESHLYVLMR